MSRKIGYIRALRGQPQGIGHLTGYYQIENSGVIYYQALTPDKAVIWHKGEPTDYKPDFEKTISY